MMDNRCSPVHQSWSVRDRPPAGQADGLVSETHAEDRCGRAELTDELDRNAGLLGPSGTRRNDDAAGIEPLHFLHRDVIVSPDDDIPRELSQKLHQIECEGIVIVDHEDHRSSSRLRPFRWTGINPPAAIAIASTRARALLVVSRYSLSGTESATIPAPAWMLRTLRCAMIVLMAMQVSRPPFSPRYPTAPAYAPRRMGSSSLMISMALTFGAPETVPAGKHAFRTSTASAPSFNVPWISDTRCITCEYRSTRLNTGTRTLPYSEILPTSFRPR